MITWRSKWQMTTYAPYNGPLQRFIKFTWFPSLLCWPFNGCGKCVLNDEWISCVRYCYFISDILKEAVLLTSLVRFVSHCWRSRISWIWRDAQGLKRVSNNLHWCHYHIKRTICVWRCICCWWDDILKIQSSSFEANVLGRSFWSPSICGHFVHSLNDPMWFLKILPWRMNWKHMACYEIVDG